MSATDSKIEPPGVRAHRLQIERPAIEETWCDWSRRDKPYGASEGEIELSKAISLKRIADALDSESPRGSLLYWLEQIASAANAGRQ